jgi:hypothetical protein
MTTDHIDFLVAELDDANARILELTKALENTVDRETWAVLNEAATARIAKLEAALRRAVSWTVASERNPRWLDDARAALSPTTEPSGHE